MRLYQKKTPTQVFACEYCETFKNSYLWNTSRGYLCACGVAPRVGGGGGQAAAGYYSLGQGIWGKI